MQKPDLHDSFIIEDKTIKVEWFDITDVKDLPDVEWQQVYAISKLDGRVPLVLYDDDHANLPGGKTELGEGIEDTLRRELIEELNCRVLNWNPIGYQKLTQDGTNNTQYQLRVYADIEKIGEFHSDPGGEVVGYKLVNLEKLNSEINYGKVGMRMMNIVNHRFN